MSLSDQMALTGAHHHSSGQRWPCGLSQGHVGPLGFPDPLSCRAFFFLNVERGIGKGRRGVAVWFRSSVWGGWWQERTGGQPAVF